MYLSLVNDLLNVNIDTNEKYTFIQGFSGAGKSLFVQEVEASIEIEDDTLKTSNKCYVISNPAGVDSIPSLIANTEEPIIFIADEQWTSKVINKILGKSAYGIFVTRKLPSELNFSYRCIYTAKRTEEGITIIEHDIDLEKDKIDGSYTLLATEDEKAGCDYFNKSIKIDVESTQGKSNIINYIKNCNVPNVILSFDGVGIGSYIKRIIKICDQKREQGHKYALIVPECFEEVLLNSELLRNIKHNQFDLTCDNIERFYEEELRRITENTVLIYDHEKQRLSDCWIVECSQCSQFGNCKFAVETDKINAVLGKSAYKDLLIFRR
jgi:hypothetical protein